MFKKQHIRTGSVFELKLDRDTAYGYVKMIISTDVDSTETFIETEWGNRKVRPWLMFVPRIYNVFSPTPMKLKDFDASRFETDDLLCFPPLMYWRPKLKGHDSYRFVGTSGLTAEDRVLPDYVQRGPDLHQESELRTFMEQHGSISYMSGLRLPPLYSTSFDAVKHLATYPDYVQNTGIIRFLTMHWLKEHGRDPLEFYSKYMDGEYHADPEFDDIQGGNVLFSRDNDTFRKMEKVRRMKCKDNKEYWHLVN